MNGFLKMIVEIASFYFENNIKTKLTHALYFLFSKPLKA